MDSDRIEKLVTLVLEETREFRHEIKQEIAGLRHETKQEIAAVRRDIGLLQTAVLDVAQSARRVEAKVDDHGARLDKLEGAAE